MTSLNVQIFNLLIAALALINVHSYFKCTCIKVICCECLATVLSGSRVQSLCVYFSSELCYGADQIWRRLDPGL